MIGIKQRLRTKNLGLSNKFTQRLIPIIACLLVGGLAYLDTTLAFDDSLFVYAKEEIAPFAVVDDSEAVSAKLTYAKVGTDAKISANRGDTNYGEYTVSMESKYAKSYNLMISGDTDLVYYLKEDTPSTNVDDKLGSANGAKGASLNEGTWGYAWTTESGGRETLNYTAPTSAGANIVENQPVSATAANGEFKESGTLVFAAKFRPDQPEGDYKAKVSLLLMVTPRDLVTFSITYDCNGVADCPAPTTGESRADSAKLKVTNAEPTRENYTFLGWADSSTAVDAQYQAGHEFTLSRTDPEKKVVAIWKANRIYMQEMTFDQCTTAGVEVYDKRNENVSYTVKLIRPSGLVSFCWMTSNLKLPAGTKLTKDDSNVSSNFTLPTESWASNLQNYYCRPIMASSGGEFYYNWYAATANPTNCSNPTSNTNATAANDAKSLGDICPKGWELPTFTETSNSTWRGSVASSLTYTGYFYSGSVNSGGSYGYWWTSTRNNNDHAYSMRYYGGAATSYEGDYKVGGFSIRCMMMSS